MKTKLKLFVWTEYARDYSSGLAVAIAKDSDQARKMIVEKCGYTAPELANEPEVFPLTKSIAFQTMGGG